MLGRDGESMNNPTNATHTLTKLLDLDGMERARDLINKTIGYLVSSPDSPIVVIYLAFIAKYVLKNISDMALSEAHKTDLENWLKNAQDLWQAT